MIRPLALGLALWGATAGAPAPPLLPGEAQPRVFTPPAARHEHTLAVEAGAYVRVQVLPRDCDVVVTLRRADGQPLAEVDDDWTDGGEELEWVGGAEGVYRLEVRSKRPAVAGSYEATLAETRPATDADRTRVAAAGALWRGAQLLQEQKAERTPEAVIAFEEARS
ncbi:MAG TPA: hypothetical protein VFO85_14810, partial [Vicinamibacteria bacterium]|nr:hypothetical protein [Vicinamibacteria bacterium]